MFYRAFQASIVLVASHVGLSSADAQMLSAPTPAKLVQTPHMLMAQVTTRRQREPVRTLASFSQRDKWSYTGGSGEGQVVVMADGKARLQVYVLSASGSFKYFAEPHVVLFVTDEKGKVIQTTSVSGLAMRMATSGVFEKEDRGYANIPSDRLDDVAYAFFSFKYCGWQQTSARNIGANNGCAQSSLQREYDIFTKMLPGALTSLNVNAGDYFELKGWFGVRIKQTRQ